MKKMLFLLPLMLCYSFGLMAQNCPPLPPSDNKVYSWCYTPDIGTNWDTSPYKAYIINGMPFRLLFPKDYNSTAAANKKYPLMIMIHGIGEKGTDNNHQLQYGGKNHLDAVNSGKFDGFVMVPQSPTEYFNTAERSKILKFIEYAIQNYRVDAFRVQLQGYSAGGGTTWKLAYENPKVFSGIIPMSSADATVATYASVLKYTAVWHSQGGRDDSPKPVSGNNVASKFKAVGANYRYQYYHELGHGTWKAMYLEPDFFSFMMQNTTLRIHALNFKYNFCSGEVISGTLGVKQGFEGYEWRKDGASIGGSTNELQFTSEGQYTVRIKHNGVWSAWSEPLKVQRVPSTATPTIIATGPTALPTLDGRTSVTLRTPKGFQNYKWSNSSTLDSLVVKSAGSYSVSVTEAYGCPSASSAPIVVTVNKTGVLPAPSSLTVATASETQLDLKWTDNSTNEMGFEVYRGKTASGPWVLAAQLPANTTSYQDKQLETYTRFYYSVRAHNNSGGSQYATGSGKTMADVAAPAAPGDLQVIKTNRSSIHISWLPSTDNADQPKDMVYEVFTNNKSTLVTTTTKTEWIIKDLPEKQRFNFAVRAVDQQGNRSEFSNQATAATIINGLSYTYLEGNINTVNEISGLPVIKKGWTSNFDIVSHRQKNDFFAFRFDGYLNITTAGTYTFFTKSDDGSTVMVNGALVVNNDGIHSSTNEKSGTINLTAGFHPITLLYFERNGTGERLEVRWQGPGVSKQLIPDAAFKETSSLPNPPAAPTSVIATAVNYHSNLIKWADNSSNESGFEVFRSTANTGPFVLVKTTPANATQYQDADLASATKYYYKVRAAGSTGESDFAGKGIDGIWVNATTKSATGTLTAPALLSANRESTTSVRLSWKDNSGNEEGFEVYRNDELVKQVNDNTSGYLDISASGTTSHTYKVKAYNSSGTSAWSNVISIGLQNHGTNKPPVIANIPSVVVAPEGNTTEIAFDISDPNGDALNLISRYLPSFASIEKTSATKGKISVSPTVKDIGYHTGIQVTATDGSLEADVSFSINVKNSEKTATYINFTYAHSELAQKPWNNTNVFAGSANKIIPGNKNLLDENGKGTGYYITLVQPFTSNKSYGESSLYDNGLYPNAVTKSTYIVNPGKTAQFKISGLKANLRYNLVFYGSSIYKSNNGSTRYTVGSETVSLQVQSNSDKTVQINGIKADANGEAWITVNGASDATKGGYLNALIIEQYDDNGQVLRPGRLTAAATTTTQVELSWTDNSYQETGFEIWRRMLPAGSFTKVATTAANATSYTDNGLAANTGYEYKVRAVSGTKFSAYSETKQAATLLYDLLLNVNKDTQAKADLPWNNLNRLPLTGYTWYNLKDRNAASTYINFKLLEGFDGGNNFGPDAKGLGIYPDKVIKSFYFNEIGTIAQIRVYGLDPELLYNFRFFASTAFGTENGVSEYRIGNKKATLDAQANLKNTAVIRDVEAVNGEVIIEVEAGEFARYGYLSALVIEARDGSKEVSGTSASAAKTTDAVSMKMAAEEPLQAATVYPNPSDGEYFVDYSAPAEGNCLLQVTDLRGKIIYSQEVRAQKGDNSYAVDLRQQNIDKGIYILRILSDNDQVRFIRIMKQ
jgi:predicted esterase